MNQISNPSEFVELAQKIFPSFVIVAFNSAKVWSNTLGIVTRATISHLKGLKSIIILKLVIMKFMKNYFHVVVFAIFPLQMKTKINQNLSSLNVVNFIKYGMNFSVRNVVQQLRSYQQCAKKWYWGGFVYIFEVCLKWSEHIHILNASGKT